MIGIIARRLLGVVPLMLGMILFVFLIMALSPYNAAMSVLGDQATPEQIAAFNREHGLDGPLLQQYFTYVWALVRGQMGDTFALNQPIAGIVARALPVTAQLTVLAVIGGLALALTLGIFGALYRGTWVDNALRVLSIIGFAMPSFWLAILLIQRLSTIGGGPFPSGHYISPSESWSGWLMSMALPAISVAVPVGCALARIVRTSMVEELDRDYVRTAVGGGVPWTIVVGRNVLRNALITPLTMLGLQIGYLIGGAVIVEAIFVLPGMGTEIMRGVQQNDVGLVRALVITIALTFVVVNLVVDVLYLAANPRLRRAG